MLNKTAPPPGATRQPRKVNDRDFMKQHFPPIFALWFGRISLVLSICMVIFEVATNTLFFSSIFDKFNYLSNGQHPVYYSILQVILSLALGMGIVVFYFHAIFRDTSGYYGGLHARYTSESMHKHDKWVAPGGWMYWIMSICDDSTLFVTLLISIVTDVMGFCDFEKLNWMQFFTNPAIAGALLFNILVSIYLNYGATMGLLRAFHVLDHGKHTGRIEERIIAALPAPMPVKVQEVKANPITVDAKTVPGMGGR